MDNVIIARRERKVSEQARAAKKKAAQKRSRKRNQR